MMTEAKYFQMDLKLLRKVAEDTKQASNAKLEYPNATGDLCQSVIFASSHNEMRHFQALNPTSRRGCYFPIRVADSGLHVTTWKFLHDDALSGK